MSIDIDKRSVYLDNAASTPIDPNVKKEMTKTLELYANPSSFNDCGRLTRKKIDESRLVIAKFLGARIDEIIFTASGTEANNLAILGLANGLKPGEILTTPIEHLSVAKPIERLKKKNWKVTYLKIDSRGSVSLSDLKNKLNSRVLLISIIYANNEIGTIQPVKTIAKIINNFRNREFKIREKMFPFFHVDACQAAGYLDMNVNHLGVDLLTFNGTKICGPKGVAVLYKKRGVVLNPLIFGGDQERGLRAGTENLPAIASLAKAVLLINKSENNRLARLRDYFFEKIIKLIPDIKINGPLGNSRLANNINIAIPGISSEQLLLELDKYRIYASSGSACMARSVDPSHVLKAIGLEEEYLNSVIRFSLGRQTTKKDIEYVLKILPKVIIDLRGRYSK